MQFKSLSARPAFAKALQIAGILIAISLIPAVLVMANRSAKVFGLGAKQQLQLGKLCGCHRGSRLVP